MRTIAIINQKGGCGKTTVAINLASVLASRGRRTLLIDMDPQSHCALGLAVPEAQIDRSIADLLRAGLSGQLSLGDIVWQISRNLDLAPASTALAGIELELANVADRDRRLAHVLSTVADDYDFCIVDCPPSIGLLTFNALRAAGEVIVPVETGYFSLQGSIKQEATIQMLAERAQHRCRFRVLATMYDVRTKLGREILSELRRHFGDKLLPMAVHYNSKLREAASFGQPITEYDPASRGFQDFDKLASWLLANPPVVRSAQSASNNPAMNRAAELVQRARALASRSAALTQRFDSDPELQRDPGEHTLVPVGMPSQTSSGDPAPRDEAPAQAPRQAAQAQATSQNPAADHRDQPQADPHATPMDAHRLAAAQRLSEKLAGTPLGQTIRSSRPQASASAPEDQPATSSNAPHASADDPQRAQMIRKICGVRRTAQGLLFVQPLNGAVRMAVAGDFNQWSADATPMTRDEKLGIWQVCVPVEPGRYRYRLVVDGKWKPDPYNKNVETNPFGELNNIVEEAVRTGA